MNRYILILTKCIKRIEYSSIGSPQLTLSKYTFAFCLSHIVYVHCFFQLRGSHFSVFRIQLFFQIRLFTNLAYFPNPVFFSIEIIFQFRVDST